MRPHVHRRSGFLFLIALALAAASGFGFFECSTQLVSIGTGGNPGNSHSFFPAISGDGRFVAFTSEASNMVSGDTNGVADVFVRDREAGTTSRVSVSSAEIQASGRSVVAAISADGRYVAFDSSASNLVPSDSNGHDDIFVRDRQAGTTTRVSIDGAGGQANRPSNYPSISGDGRYVAFHSFATNLVAGDTNTCDKLLTPGECADVFVHDRQTGATTRVSVDSAGTQGNHLSAVAAISRDGRFVAFTSQASNLVAGDTNTCPSFPVPGECLDVFVHDRQSGVTERVSVSGGGGQSNELSIYPAISGDGRYVAFVSVASNLVSDTNGVPDIFVRDRQAGTTQRVSIGNNEAQADFFSFDLPAISADGRYVAFSSYAQNLVANDTNTCDIGGSPLPCPDIFLRDRQAGTTEIVSIGGLDNEANGPSFFAAVSDDGGIVAFDSDAASLVGNDTNGATDVFIRVRSSAAASTTALRDRPSAEGSTFAEDAPVGQRPTGPERSEPWDVGWAP